MRLLHHPHLHRPHRLLAQMRLVRILRHQLRWEVLLPILLAVARHRIHSVVEWHQHQAHMVQECRTVQQHRLLPRCTVLRWHHHNNPTITTGCNPLWHRILDRREGGGHNNLQLLWDTGNNSQCTHLPEVEGGHRLYRCMEPHLPCQVQHLLRIAVGIHLMTDPLNADFQNGYTKWSILTSWRRRRDRNLKKRPWKRLANIACKLMFFIIVFIFDFSGESSLTCVYSWRLSLLVF